MADDTKPEVKSFEIHSWNYWLIGFFVLFFIIAGFSTGGGVVNVVTDPNNNFGNPNEPLFSTTNLVGQGDLALGVKVEALKELQVRNSPGGAILGLQKELSEGKIMEGPLDQFGTSWWRVNFNEIPSGWVESSSITSRTKSLTFIKLPSIIYDAYKPIGYLLSFILLIAFLYFSLKYNEEVAIERKNMQIKYEQAIKDKNIKQKTVRDELGVPTHEEVEYVNPRWEHVKELMNSKNQSDWRQAIIEADIILDEMLRRMSYKGLTIGDMLKEVEPSDFVTLDKAWEAHKFRNEIAHTGSEFKISREEAERVIGLFQAVFGEFYYV